MDAAVSEALTRPLALCSEAGGVLSLEVTPCKDCLWMCRGKPSLFQGGGEPKDQGL